jgi:hypothetical protein
VSPWHGRLVEILGLDQDNQSHLASAHGGEAVLHARQVAGDQGKQVAGLGERGPPRRRDGAHRQDLRLDKVAVAQQLRTLRAIRIDCHPVGGHHIGAIREPGDLAKTLGLALGAEQPAGSIQSLERGIVLGKNTHTALEYAAGRHAVDMQRLIDNLTLSSGTVSPLMASASVSSS